MATRRSKNYEFLQNSVYPYIEQKDNDFEVIYLKYTEPSKKYEGDEMIKFHELEFIEEDKNDILLEVSEKQVEYQSNDILKSIVDCQSLNKIVNGTKKQLVKIQEIENLRFIKLAEQKEEALAKKKGIDLAKKKEQDKILEKQRQKEKLEEEKRQKELEKELRNPNFKKGLHNKNIKNLTEKSQKELSADSKFNTNCCTYCNEKELIRAAETGNIQLFKEILKSKFKISSLYTRQALDRNLNCIEAMFKNNDIKMFEIFVDFIQNKRNDPKQYIQAQQPRCHLRRVNRYYNNKFQRGYFDSRSIVHTQHVPVRGGGEGSNAFMCDQYREGELSDYTFERLLTYDCDIKFFDLLRVSMGMSMEEKINNKIGLAVRCGNRNLAYKLINFLNTKRSGWGYNQLHEEALIKEKADEVYDFKTQSILKQPLSEIKVNPLHCACINPNADILERILTQKDESQFTDEQGFKLVHYAAACIGPGPLDYLVNKKKLSPLDANMQQGNNALHIACLYGRAKTVQMLCKKKSLVNFEVKNHQQQSAIHLACLSGDLNTVKALVEAGCPLTLEGEQNMLPIHYAAAIGNFEIVEYILNKKPTQINSEDQVLRTPLIYAVRNNNVKVVSYLLQKGADYDQQDKSDNFPIHYACAYGYEECVSLLYEAGCELNYYNTWNITPLCVALLKGHTAIVEQMLNYEEIDINCTDDLKQTLLFLETTMLFDINGIEELDSKFRKIDFLLKKGANPDIPNQQEETPLHIILKNYIHNFTTLARSDKRHSENQQNPFYLKIREKLKLKEKDPYPAHQPENRLFYEQANKSQKVKERTEELKKTSKDLVGNEDQINQFIENERQRLVQENDKKIVKEIQEQTQIRLIKSLLKNGANPAVLNKSMVSPIQQAFNFISQNDTTLFYTVIENAKNLDLTEGFNQPVVYMELAQLLRRQDKFDEILELFYALFKLDKKLSENLKIVDQEGYSTLMRVLQLTQLQPLIPESHINYKGNTEENKKQQLKTNEERQQKLNAFIKFLRILIEKGSEADFRIQRLEKIRKKKGKNYEIKDENYDMSAEIEAEEEKLRKEQEAQIDEEGNPIPVPKKEVKKAKGMPLEQQYGHEGEQNAYHFIVSYKQDFILDLFPIFLENKVSIIHRNIRNQTPFHQYIQSSSQLKIPVLNLFLENMKYPHLFRYQSNTGSTFIHDFLQNVSYSYQVPEDILPPHLSFNERQEVEQKYKKDLIQKLFYIQNVNKLFKITNNYNQTPLLILLASSQSTDHKTDIYFRELLQIDEVIETIKEVQDNKMSCIHTLFQNRIHNLENLDKLLTYGGHELLNIQLSKLVGKGRGKNRVFIETESLRTPLHILIESGNIRSNVLEMILKYPEGRESLSLKDNNGKNPLFYLVERGYGPLLIPRLVVKEQINDLSASNEIVEGHTVLSKFLNVYQESDKTLKALQAILDAGSDLNFVESKDLQEIPLIVKVLQKQKYRFAEALFKKGQKINFLFKYYQTFIEQPQNEDFYYIKKTVTNYYNPLLNSIQLMNVDITENLLKLKADPNFKDINGRTSLHLAFNLPANNTDQALAMQQLLLNFGAKMLQDDLKRTPVHYLFTKFQPNNPTQSSNYREIIDPFESISYISGFGEYDELFKQQDIYGKSVLHYAAISNASMSLRFLLKRKAKFLDLEQKDKYGNTPLALAFMHGSSEVAQILIGANAQLNSRVFYHREDIHNYYEKPPYLYREQDWVHIEDEEDEEKKKQLIKQRDETKAKDKEFYKYNIFEVSIKSNWQAVCSLLIEYNYDFQEACETAFKQSQFQMARSLLFKSDVKEIKLNEDGQNLLHILGIYGYNTNKKLAKKLYFELTKSKLDTQLQDKNGKTPLHYAAENNFIYMAKHLITDQNVDVNVQDKENKQTALHIAIIKNHTALVDKVIEKASEKFNFTIQDVKGRTVLHYAFKNYISPSLGYPLVYKKAFGRIESEIDPKLVKPTTQQQFLLNILKENPEIVDIADSKNKNALYFALKYKNIFGIKHLVENKSSLQLQSTSRKKLTPAIQGVCIGFNQEIFHFMIKNHQKLPENKRINFSSQCYKGNNVLIIAAQQNQFSIFEQIPSGFDLNVQNSEGKTALHNAIKERNERFYVKLLSLKANPNLVDSEGNLPLHYACQNNDFYAAQLLLEAGSLLNNLNNEHKSPLCVAITQNNYLLAAKIIEETQIDLSNEFVITYSQERHELLRENKIDEVNKNKLLDNYYATNQLVQQHKFIYNIKTKKDTIEGKRKDVFDIQTVDIQPTLLYLFKENIEFKNSLFKKSAPVQRSHEYYEYIKRVSERKRKASSGMEIEDEKNKKETGVYDVYDDIYWDVCQREFQPSIPDPKGRHFMAHQLKRGQNPFQKDLNGEYLFIKAIKRNDVFLVTEFLDYIKENKQLIVDKETGRNPIQICVQPLEYGSYQNVEILKALIKAGFDINHVDKDGNTAFDLAVLQDQNQLIDTLEDNGAIRKKKKLNIKREATSIVGNLAWGKEEVDYKDDCLSYLEYIEKKYKITYVDDIEAHPDVSQTSGIGYGDFEVSSDRKGDLDALLTQVDVKQGTHGQNVYHKMQVVYSDARRVYLLFTNWGRIGTKGQSTCVAYHKKNEAVKAFQEMFQEKTGNTWQKRDEFVKKEGLYNFHSPVPRKNYEHRIPMFNFKQIEEGSGAGILAGTKAKDLKKPPIKPKVEKEISEILKEILNLDQVKRQFRNYKINQDLFNIDPEILQEAQQILTDLKISSEELKEELKNIVEADMDRVHELKYQIADQSNNYYNLIPELGYSNTPLPFLENISIIRQKEQLITSLQQLNTTAEMICGAHAKLHYKNVHPSDYIFSALQLRIQRLDINHPERKLVQKYIGNTYNDSKKIKGIYALERKGEAEKISQYKNTPNRLLLFYPVNSIDILSVLANGIKGSTPGGAFNESQKLQYSTSFGQGIYFSDAFSYSIQYLQSSYWHQVKVDQQLSQQKQVEELLQKKKKEENDDEDEEEESEISDEEGESEMEDQIEEDEEESEENLQQQPKKTVGGLFGGSYNYFQQQQQQQKPKKTYKYVFVCEVAVGEYQALRRYQDVEKTAQPDKSVKGEGKSQPLAYHNIILPNGAQVPSGKIYNLEQEEKAKLSTLTEEEVKKYIPLEFDYNQYVVYDESRVRIRYLIQVEE